MLEFVVLPVCLFCAWRYLFLRKTEKGKDAGKAKSRLLLQSVVGISGMLIAYLILENIFSGFVLPKRFDVMIVDNTVDQNRSALMAQLSRIAFKANEYYCLPKSAGGGEKSYRSWLDPSGKNLITLQELGMPGATNAGTFSVVRIVNDTTLLCKAVGTVALSDGSYPEYTMRISPGGITPTKLN